MLTYLQEEEIKALIEKETQAEIKGLKERLEKAEARIKILESPFSMFTNE